jgi:hypothetical protein
MLAHFRLLYRAKLSGEKTYILTLSVRCNVQSQELPVIGRKLIDVFLEISRQQ